jgi:hypothetical protein
VALTLVFPPLSTCSVSPRAFLARTTNTKPMPVPHVEIFTFMVLFTLSVISFHANAYSLGQDYELIVSRFQRLYDLGKAKDDYNLQTLTDLRAIVFQESIDTNPYFFNGPFPGLLGTSLHLRRMLNKSDQF